MTYHSPYRQSSKDTPAVHHHWAHGPAAFVGTDLCNWAQGLLASGISWEGIKMSMTRSEQASDHWSGCVFWLEYEAVEEERCNGKVNSNYDCENSGSQS